MKYYVTQTGRGLLEGYKAGDYKKAEDVAAEKVKKRVLRQEQEVRRLVPPKKGKDQV